MMWAPEEVLEIFNFNNPFFDEADSSALYGTENVFGKLEGGDLYDAIDDFKLTTGRNEDKYGNNSIFDQIPFQEYLKTKGLNKDTLYDELISPNIQTFDEFKASSLFQRDQYGDMSDEDYNNLVYTQYENSITPTEEKIFKKLTEPYDEMRKQTYIDDISNKYGMTPELASSLLFRTDENNDGELDLNMGIFNDLLNNFQDMSSLSNEFGVSEEFTDKYTDYQTEEGEEFFTDPLMELAGFSLGKSLTGNLGLKAALQKNPLLRKTLGQAYPGIAGLRLNAYPAIPNAIKQLSNKFRGTDFKPTYTKRPYGINPLVRAGAQTYAAGALTDEKQGLNLDLKLPYGQY